ncbi:MAG: prepilin-type N-terminal cleavage/methylation domain-containing protein [Oscillospiraceae bacterium]|nr:prepilin-type N-terminal cleavage/methylation domain-containing protein [Oscillospiraceae bacterium]
MKSVKKKTVKGMTLIEIIIAILVLGVMGTMMCLIGSTVAKVMIDTNHLNNKTTAEAPIAIAQDANSVVAAPTTVGSIKITTTNGGFSDRTVPLSSVEKYSTKEYGDALGEQGQSNMNGNIVFYKLND